MRTNLSLVRGQRISQRIIENDRNIKEINNEVDEFIDFIKKRKKNFISKDNFIPWDYETKFSPAPHIKRGYIDVKDNVVLSNHRDALRCFGYKGGHFQQAVWKIKGTSKGVWFPKLYKNSTWNNSLSDDFKIIKYYEKIKNIPRSTQI